MPRSRAAGGTNVLSSHRLPRNPQRYRRQAHRRHGRELRRILGGEAGTYGTKAIAWRCELGRGRPPDVPRRMVATRADPDGVSISHGTRKPIGCALVYLWRKDTRRGFKHRAELVPSHAGTHR